jgi:SAM-dependent methyltransferase
VDTQGQSSALLKSQQRDHWDAVAGGWGEWLEWTERNFMPITNWLRDCTTWSEATHVLDVACGAGYPALSMAAEIPEGRVLATDISAEMVEVASRWAKARGLARIVFAEMDAEALRCQDNSFEVVTHAYGLMFCPDPAQATAEAYRVLAPGGRFGVAVWDQPSASPFFTVIRDPAERALGLRPQEDPQEPGPFRLASSNALRSLLEGAGFSRVRVDQVPAIFECSSVAEYIRIFTDFAWKSKMAALTDEQQSDFRRAVAEAAQPFLDGARLRLRATSLCASGCK